MTGRRGGVHMGLVLAACVLTACATRAPSDPQAESHPIEGAVTQPFEDLSLVRKTVPEILTDAAATPYAAEEFADCAAIWREVARLDAVLGPDVDIAVENDSGVPSILSDALRGALGLPFRGVIRHISGAARRDREKARAVLAGMVRRGFLKGMGQAKGCPPPAPSASP